MQGIIIAGGIGSRLGLYTARVSNKALALVYKNLVIEYSLNTLVSAGITDIVIVTGGSRYTSSLMGVLGDGKEFGCTKLTYVFQNEPKGISHAIYQAKNSVYDKFAVILSDNFFEDNIIDCVHEFEESSDGCNLFYKKVHDPERYGVAELGNDNQVLNIVEKPKEPKTNCAVTGLYFYDINAFNYIEQLTPSARGEFEVTDLNMRYVMEKKCKAYELKGHWDDMGTPESILSTSNYVKQSGFKLKYTVNA